MKAEMTVREKVMLGILGVLVLFCVYYFVFLVPTNEKIETYKSDTLLLEDQILMADAKVAKMEQMQAELDEIMAGNANGLKELPAYDNSNNVMAALSTILEKSNQYNISFSNVVIEDNTVRRNISLNYTCDSYNNAKSILNEIYEGDYRCILKDLYLTSSSSEESESYNVSVDITYFEYQ